MTQLDTTPITAGGPPAARDHRADAAAMTYYAVRCPRCRHWELPTPFTSPARFPNRRMDPPVASCQSGRIVSGQPCTGMWVEHRLVGPEAHDRFMAERAREAAEQREQAKRAEPKGGGQ